MIEDVLPSVFDKMVIGIRNARGQNWRIWCIPIGDGHVLKVSAPGICREPELRLCQSASLMDVSDKARLLADLYDIVGGKTWNT